MEFRIAARILEGLDYHEGVRAAIIDKDRRPLWKPADIAAVSAADIDPYFLPLDDELTFRTLAAAT